MMRARRRTPAAHGRGGELAGAAGPGDSAGRATPAGIAVTGIPPGTLGYVHGTLHGSARGTARGTAHRIIPAQPVLSVR